MKRKYCLVRTDGDLSVGSFVYVVWAGSSLHESGLLALVEEYCKDCGWYFKRWSPNVDSALEKRSKLRRLDGTLAVKPYQMIRLSIQECYDAIIDDSFSSIEANQVMKPQEIFMRFRKTPEYLMAMNVKQRNTTRPPLRSKYLSHRKLNGFYSLAPAMAALVMLFLLDAFISHVLNNISF